MIEQNPSEEVKTQKVQDENQETQKSNIKNDTKIAKEEGNLNILFSKKPIMIAEKNNEPVITFGRRQETIITEQQQAEIRQFSRFIEDTLLQEDIRVETVEEQFQNFFRIILPLQVYNKYSKQL